MRSALDRRPPQRSRSDDRRDALLDALESCLREATFDKVSLADIAASAGVSRPSFYFYFENKAAALAALMDRMTNDAFVLSTEFVDSTDVPEVRIETMLAALFDTVDRHRYMFAAMVQARGHSEAVRQVWDQINAQLVGRISDMIRTERDRGAAPRGIDPTVLASVLLEFNDRLLERLALGGPLSREQMMIGAKTVWLGAIYGRTAAHPDEGRGVQ
ncbi:TetR/AcrR family transcriptional regulator [Mycolicibacillus parakoreensis]|uniref:TetR/AcrR family transcriptional regulator n=1 Tax=Mycolicibacillus parakoreensis TaxID=1069221 RepID=A0ABY3U4I9_9MYCO|nr:TetR/AcrR family transcriptional regulator [Mycolicibacillus parakoreensis]MCV7314099.1 TetR/AcrR family transcriptional regulator [Mycolicibacillus parakoreensis]ULN54050.1 TetR/AcrR family transcriptional regulator [Mycolicibacillus parakoreensis]